MKTTGTPLLDTLSDWWLRNDLFDPAGVFTNTAIFVESYPIRGGLARARQLGASAPSTATEAVRSGGRPRTDGLAEDALVRRDVKTDDERDNLARVAALGVDGLEGVAFPPLGDVELDEALRLTGDRFIITGGISAMEFERLTTREAVFGYVRELCGRMKPYAHRFLLSASCNTPVTAPWERIVWFRDAWREYA